MALSNDYLAGLLDGQFGVAFRKDTIKAILSNTDDRISGVVRTMFSPTKETVVKTPKKTTCVMEFVGEDARKVLEFVKNNCPVRQGLAEAALGYLDGTTPQDTVLEKAKVYGVPDEVSDEWIGGFFDAKGEVSSRKAVRVITTKGYPDGILESIRKTTGGKIKKCRLVFDTKAAIKNFVDVCGDHVRVRRELVA